MQEIVPGCGATESVKKKQVRLSKNDLLWLLKNISTKEEMDIALEMIAARQD